MAIAAMDKPELVIEPESFAAYRISRCLEANLGLVRVQETVAGTQFLW